MIRELFRRLKSRIRYRYRALMFAVGRCPDCLSRFRMRYGHDLPKCPNSAAHHQVRRRA